MQTIRFPAAIAFVGSFCLMVLELVAGRVMAPYLGVSLYTWTSIIGVILAGLSLGAYVGGVIADRNATERTLGGLFALAGLTTMFAVYLSPVFGSLLESSRLPLLASTLLFSAVNFLPPSLFLGCITPVIVKLTLTSLDKTGITVGRVSAAGALGSIAGTFAAGYVLIALIGVKVIMLGVAGTLILLGAVIAGARAFSYRTPLLVAFFAIGSFAVPSPCAVESAYYCIQIKPMPDGSILRLDHLVHSYVRPSHPANLGYGYENAFALILAAQGRPAPKTAFIGGGGYVLPRYLEQYYPGALIDVVEIDPAVTRINHERLELPETTKIRTSNEDARRFFDRLPGDARYDAVFGDAFNDLSVPYHLTTREFTAQVASHLADDGFYAVNVIDDPRSGRFLSSMVRTLAAVFPRVILMPLREDWLSGARNTFVIVGLKEGDIQSRLATAQPIAIRDLGFPATEEGKKIRYVVPDAEQSAYVTKQRGIVLTDDHAPVETLLAPVFSAAFQ